MKHFDHKYYQPCRLDTPFVIASFGRIEVLAIVMAKLVLLACAVALVVGVAQIGTTIYREIREPTVKLPPNALGDAQAKVDEAEQRNRLVALAVGHANYRLSNTAILNSLLSTPASSGSYRLTRTEIKAVPFAQQARSEREDSGRRTFALSYRTTFWWSVRSADMGATVVGLCRTSLAKFRPDFAETAPTLPWKFAYSSKQDRKPDGTSDLPMHLEITVDAEPPARLYVPREGKTKADVQANLEAFYRGNRK